MFNIALLGAGNWPVHAANIAITVLPSGRSSTRIKEFATRLATQYQARLQSLDEAMTDLTFTPC
jgi:myo-inositol 2-dehydrogenase/D-chiro-inositol 1-dehydrogenase